jgi:DMSO/TMAO reductase YedYZ molybdopterin-dependent catalytic subunit
VNVRWGGFRFTEIMCQVAGCAVRRLPRSANDGSAVTLDHYTECFTIESLTRQKRCRSLHGQKPLPHDHGAPLRVVSPYDLAAREASSSSIEFARGGSRMVDTVGPSTRSMRQCETAEKNR